MRTYQLPGLILDKSSTSPDQQKLTLALQIDLRALGYLSGGLDGRFGAGVAVALAALTFDLLNNDGASRQQDGAAPVAMTSYNRGRVQSIQTYLNQSLAACLDDLLSDDRVPQLPRADHPAIENAKALAAVAAMVGQSAPPPFLLAMFVQESSSRHYAIPTKTDADDYISIGLDHGDKDNAVRITSRGYGLGQATLFHHPPRDDEVKTLMLDPIGNVRAAFSELRRKFDRFLVGPDSRADDRDAEHPGLRLRMCRYAPADPKFLLDCRICARSAKTTTIVDGVPLYPGSSQIYRADALYPSADYGQVPDRAAFLCDWPYAARRYNGSGLDSFHYQTRILANLSRLGS